MEQKKTVVGFLVDLGIALGWMRQRVCDTYEDDALKEVIDEIERLQTELREIANGGFEE